MLFRSIGHYRLTTQEFVASLARERLGDVGLLFIDGLHTYEHARFDHEAFAACLTDDAVVVLFHDSVRIRTSRMYGVDRPYQHRVKD